MFGADTIRFSLSLVLTDGIGDDVTKEAPLRHDPRPLVRVLEVTRLQRLEELPAQQLEADVHLGGAMFVNSVRQEKEAYFTRGGGRDREGGRGGGLKRREVEDVAHYS